MWQNLLLKLTITCALLATAMALIDMHDRLKNRVIHIETLIHRGRWLWQNDHTDSDGSRYLWIDLLDIRDTYYTPRVQYQTSECGSYLCLESLSLPRYYLAAGFPAGGSKYVVKLEYDTYTADDSRYHWKVMCEDDTLEKCKVIPVRFENDGYMMVADNWGSDGGHDGGHYDASLGKDESIAWFRVHAPNPSDGYNEIYRNTNNGDTDQQVKYTTKVGVTQTQSQTHSVTSTVSMEIGGAFKAFSASASSSISNTWETTASSTYEAAKEVEHQLTLPAHKTIVLSQLIGNYDDHFDVGDDEYKIDEMPAAGGPATTSYFHG